MKVGGQIPWNVTPICETSQIYYLMGRRPMKDALEIHLKDQSFHLFHWLSITLFLRKTSQESINLERKSYVDCALDTLCTWKELEGWRTDRRPWGVGNDGRIGNLLKKTQCKGSNISHKNGNFISPFADGRIKFVGGDQELKTSTLIRQRPIRGEGQRDFLGESEGSQPSPPQDSFPDAREARNDFLVHVRKLHIPPSRWTQSQTLLAERRIIPYSTEIYWRNQNYT